MSVVGTYKLTKYGYTYKKDGRFEPISDYYSGSIHYSENGTMSVIARFAENPKLEDTIGYTGTYHVKGDEIVHQVTHSVRPSYEGQTLTRKFKLHDNAIELEFENTDEFKKFAIWSK